MIDAASGRLFHFQEDMDHDRKTPRPIDPQHAALSQHFTEAIEAMESRSAAQYAGLEERVVGLEKGLATNTAATGRVEDGMKYAIGLLKAPKKAGISGQRRPRQFATSPSGPLH